MITPEVIREKASRLYPKVLRAWLESDASFFPRTIPSPKKLDHDDIPSAIRAVRELRSRSKEQLGHGYSVEWTSRRSRTFGQNDFPQRIFFSSRDDLLKSIGRKQHFEKFAAAVTRLRIEFPGQLESWFPSHIKSLMENVADIEGLIAVVRYFMEHPRPNRFARELPIEVDTKFVERHQPILRAWFDRLLPAHAIRADEKQFERRYGLRDKEPFLIVRCLDPIMQQELGWGHSELALPLGALSQLRVETAVVFVVENRVTLRTFPAWPRGLALEGRGNAVTDLRDLSWLAHNELHYWGDLDLEGLRILSALRAIFPHARSLLMDEATLKAWLNSCSSGTGRELDRPDQLTPTEQAAFDRCRKDNLRLEQERVTQAAVVQALAQIQSAD